MRFYSLSDNPNKPCAILQFKQVSLMLDCGLDLTPSLSFLPLSVVESTKPRGEPVDKPGLEGELRDCGGTVLVDSQPEVLPPQEGLFNFCDIDAILISNYTCMLALPYITETKGFRGKVYATEPSLLLGRIFMEEMIEYFDRAPRHTTATRWKAAVKQLPPPLCDIADVHGLKPLYSRQTMEAALARVQLVGCGERISVFGLLEVCPVSSGYCLGSCNWVITTEMEKIVYLSSSSTLTTHPKSMDKDSAALKGADCLIMTALTQTPAQMPDPMIGEFCRLVVETLKANGNVLVPCYPSGIIYDLFECLSQQMDMNGLTTVPLFFLSPVADSSLAYSNIMAEWLSTAKHNRVYLPEEPFVHGALQRGGRLKAFPSLETEAVQSEYRQPCVVFCGHPSLRSGDVVHFLRLWGASPANLVVFTEPSFNHQAALAPFQPLAMKALHCPIDTSLNFTQARKLVRDIRPKLVVVPEKYTVPPVQAPGRTELVIDTEVPMYKHKKLDILQLPVKSSLEHIQISSELAARLVPQEVRPGLAVATVTGQLTVKDNSYSLGLVEEGGEVKKEGKRKRDSRSSSSGPPNKFPLGKSKAQHYLYGPLDHQEFVAKLTSRGFTDAKVEKSKDAVLIHLSNEESLIQVTETETHLMYEEAENVPAQNVGRLRQVLKDTILSCVAKY